MMNNQDKNQTDTTDEAFVSKTQLKKESKALQAFGKELIAMPETKLMQLPLNETTLRAVRDYHRQSGNIARKRHLSYIGKCLRNEDAEAVKEFLREDKFSQLRSQVAETKADPLDKMVRDLQEKGDQQVQILVEQNAAIDRQALRQLVRNTNSAKDDVKRKAAESKLRSFLENYLVD
ncbi:ribosome biogenesis factor YjgA [Aliikangiella coralliicola]|uniref:DUF615 domain-containing protein n=1 Tax=Aliikangiella coralliicola TaxID=2592383 RepID=A0A545UB57_9GAMM|nr:ribosome biogenesis factor YjgA [Aliikangiella coralliicola]TQV86663.1 DUF615 domain-containing protein [Aliikangiella coralliicola]